MRGWASHLSKSRLALPLALAVAGAVLCGNPDAARPQPELLRVGLMVSDRVDPGLLPAHLRSAYPQLVDSLAQDLQLLLGSLGRIQVCESQLVPDSEGDSYDGVAPVDFLLHIVVHRFQMIFRNAMYASPSGTLVDPDTGTPYEMASEPAISARLEARLVDPRRRRVVWSGLRDTTLEIPCGVYNFLYNPAKHPGWTPPDLLHAHLADLTRLDVANPAVHNALQAGDRWFFSYPNDDLRTARRVLPGLAAAFYADLDGHLPLEGRIAGVLPGEAGETQVLLNIGARHGLTPQARLTVWRPSPSEQKVGQVEVVRVDSTSAVARLCELEKPLRQRGEGPQPGDRVISPNRSSTRRSPL